MKTSLCHLLQRSNSIQAVVTLETGQDASSTVFIVLLAQRDRAPGKLLQKAKYKGYKTMQ